MHVKKAFYSEKENEFPKIKNIRSKKKKKRFIQKDENLHQNINKNDVVYF
jgi:hypothetical protein